MALGKQNVSISLAEGLDTKTDSKQVLPGKLLLLENATFISPKKIQKCNGYTSLGTSGIEPTTTFSAMALTTYKDELNLFTNETFYSYSPDLTAWTSKGEFFDLEVTSTPIVRNTATQTSPDCTMHPTGLSVYTWEDSRGSSRYSVVDSVTGEYIVQDAPLGANVSRPKPMSVGQSVVILYVDSVTNQMSRVTLAVTTPTILSAPVLLTLNMSAANPKYDATLNGVSIYVAYNNSTGGIGMFSISAFLVQSLVHTQAGAQATEAIGVVGDVSGNFWVGYADGAAVRAFVYDSTLTVQLQPPTLGEAISGIRNVVVSVQGLVGSVFYEKSAPNPSNTSIRRVFIVVGVGLVGTPSRVLGSVGLASKAIQYNDNIFFLVAHQSPLQPTYFLISGNARIVAKAAPGIGGGLTAKTSILPELSGAGGVYYTAILQKDLVVPATTAPLNLYTQTGVVADKFDFLSATTYLTTELGQDLHITGGFVSMYDGISIVEHGFHLYPEVVSLVASPVGGLIQAGTYQYFVTYEWMDNQGNIHRSAPSIGESVTTIGATSSVSITASTLRLTNKQGDRTPVSIVFYRTAANQTQPYRVSGITTSPLNDTSVDSITFVDTLPDSAIIGNQTLYTFGGVVENIAAPAVRSLTTYNNRVIAIPSETPTSFWYSKEVVPGAPVEFSDLFVQNVDPRAGGLTGAVQLDSNLILFRKSSVSLISGTGPTATGSNNDFSDNQIITTDVGCTNQRSIVRTPIGIMFKSAKGIYLLDRSLKVDYLGAPVESFNSLTITSAELMPSVNQVRFASAEGTCLVYDYFMQQWSVFTGLLAVDAVVFQDSYVFAKVDGDAMQETAGLFTNNLLPISMKLVTSWLSLAGLQAFQRAYRLMILGDFKSNHRLKVKVAYDFNPFFTQETIIDTSTLFTALVYGGDPLYGSSSPYGGGFPLYQFLVHLTQQKCEAVQFSIEDIQTAPPYGEGMSLSALGMQVGVKTGLNKLPASRQFGS